MTMYNVLGFGRECMAMYRVTLLVCQVLLLLLA
jgi:hypothetical protein